MPRISPPLDPDELVRLYIGGKGITKLARQFRTREIRVRSELLKRGVKLRSRSEAVRGMKLVDVVNVDAYAARYLAGEGIKGLATDAGVASGTMTKRLREYGVAIRPPTAHAAHATMRGTKRSLDELERRAATRETKRLHVGPLERRFAALLAERGCEFIQQKAIGKYNVDFALDAARVAVEIVTGGGRQRPASVRVKRIEYLLDRGWHVVEIMLLNRKPVAAGAAEYVLSLAKLASGQPPGRGHHWMIWSDGQPYAARGRQVNDRA